MGCASCVCFHVCVLAVGVYPRSSGRFEDSLEYATLCLEKGKPVAKEYYATSMDVPAAIEVAPRGNNHGSHDGQNL